MESIDLKQAQRVWSRVHPPEPEVDELNRLLALESELRHIYQYLQKNTSLRDSRLLARLREESRRFFHILAGLAAVSGRDVTVTAPPSVRGNAEGLLRQSYLTRRKAMGLLERLPEGCRPCAGLLEQEMEEHCLTLLELLGQLPKK